MHTSNVPSGTPSDVSDAQRIEGWVIAVDRLHGNNVGSASIDGHTNFGAIATTSLSSIDHFKRIDVPFKMDKGSKTEILGWVEVL